MQRVIAVTVGVVLVPAMLALGASFQQPPNQPPTKPPAQVQPPAPFQDEAPIRVRNGSVEIDTLRDTAWESTGSNPWGQNRATVSTRLLTARVVFTGGGICNVSGNTITVRYKDKDDDPEKTFTVHRNSSKLFVTPRADFEPIDSRNPVTLRSKTPGRVTKVTGSSSGTASCEPGKKEELKYICVASTESGMNNCK